MLVLPEMHVDVGVAQPDPEVPDEGLLHLGRLEGAEHAGGLGLGPLADGLAVVEVVGPPKDVDRVIR